MKVDFAGGGCAYLFITWAADLAVHSTEGNDREHIDLFYMVTDQGWRLTKGSAKKARPSSPRAGSDQDLGRPVPRRQRVRSLCRGGGGRGSLAEDIVDVQMAAEDIRLLRTLEKCPGTRVTL